MRPVLAPCLTVPLLAAAASAQLMTGTLNDNNVNYTFTSYPPTNASVTGLKNLSVDPSGRDNLYNSWWWWRLDSDGREWNLSDDISNQAPPSSSFFGDTAIHTWPNVDNRGFAATLVAKAISTGPDSGFAVQQLTFANNTTGPVRLNLFAYVDADFCASAAGDSAAANPTPFKQRITDTGCTEACEVFAVGADHWQVASYPSVQSLLNDGSATTLNDSGLPFGPGDFTTAFQWRDRPLNPNESLTVTLIIGVKFVHTGCLTAADAVGYGMAKAGTNGLPAFSTLQGPLLGSITNLVISNGLTGATPIAFLSSGQANLPFPPFGTILVAPPLVSFNLAPFDASLVSSTPIQIPNTRFACGRSVFLQAFFGDAGAAGNVAHTAGLEWKFGGLR